MRWKRTYVSGVLPLVKIPSLFLSWPPVYPSLLPRQPTHIFRPEGTVNEPHTVMNILIQMKMAICTHSQLLLLPLCCLCKFCIALFSKAQ